jgi:hypothetical protein
MSRSGAAADLGSPQAVSGPDLPRRSTPYLCICDFPVLAIPTGFIAALVVTALAAGEVRGSNGAAMRKTAPA